MLSLLSALFVEVMAGCYSKFSHPDKVIHTVQVGPLVVAELWHGPTGAFKDLSLTVLGRMVDFFLRKRNKHSTVLVSTSGDTGSAAIQSVLGSQHIQLMVMYPRHMVCKIQELQMTTVDAPNVHVFSVDGTSDDADVVMANLYADTAFSKKYNLNVFNSLNVCRILVQMVHFVYLYLQQCPEVDEDVLFSIPTGGMGNITSGMLARSLGLPVHFLAAVNENDTVHRAFQSGHYSPSSTVHRTLSCAMDITYPYNMERVWYYLADGKTSFIKEAMKDIEKNKTCVIPPSVLTEAASCIHTASVGQESVLATMGKLWEEHRYLVCPHTAVGIRAALDLNDTDKIWHAGRKVVVIATATPAKFVEAVREAGLVPPSSRFEALQSLPQKKKFMEKGEDWCEVLKKAIISAWEN